MAFVRQVLLYSALLVSVYSHHHERRLLDLLNPVNILDAAARITYPITSGINNAVGTFLESRNRPPANDYYDPYERYPLYGPGPSQNGRGNSGAIAKDVVGVLLKIISGNERDTNGPYLYEPLSDEVDGSFSGTYSESSEVRYDFDFRSQTSSSLESKSVEANDAVLSTDTFENNNNPNVQSASETISAASNSPNLVVQDIEHDSIAKDAQPKIIYVILNPGNVKSGDNQDLKLAGDGSPNKSGFYFIPINRDFGTPTSNSPITSISAFTNDDSANIPSGISDVDNPNSVTLANDIPSSSVPINGSLEANNPADLVPPTSEVDQETPDNSQ